MAPDRVPTASVSVHPMRAPLPGCARSQRAPISMSRVLQLKQVPGPRAEPRIHRWQHCGCSSAHGVRYRARARPAGCAAYGRALPREQRPRTPLLPGHAGPGRPPRLAPAAPRWRKLSAPRWAPPKSSLRPSRKSRGCGRIRPAARPGTLLHGFRTALARFASPVWQAAASVCRCHRENSGVAPDHNLRPAPAGLKTADTVRGFSCETRFRFSLVH